MFFQLLNNGSHIVFDRMIQPLVLGFLLVTYQFSKACLHGVPLILDHELNRSHISVHQVPVVAKVVSPPLHTMREGPKSHLLLEAGLNAQLLEDLRHKKLIYGLLVQHVDSDGVLDLGIVAFPYLKSDSPLFVILLPEKMS